MGDWLIVISNKHQIEREIYARFFFDHYNGQLLIDFFSFGQLSSVD